MKRFLSLLLALFTAAATAQEATSALLAPAVFVSSDSEDFVVRKTTVGWAPLYRHGLDYTAVRAGVHRYASGDWTAEARQLSLARTAVDGRNGLGYQAALGLNDLGGRGLLTADVDHTLALGEATRAGVFLNRDWVETRTALDQGLFHTYYGASLEQQLAPGWTTIGLLGQQRFSDGNVRDHARLRAVHDLVPAWGLNLQYRHRHFWNSSPWGGSYFSPDAYYEDTLALGLRRRLSGWMVAGVLGAGQQRVSGDAPTPTHLAEVELTSPLAGQVFARVRAGYSDSASLTGPAYIYRYLQAELMLRF